jgi:hypothetical protein
LVALSKLADVEIGLKDALKGSELLSGGSRCGVDGCERWGSWSQLRCEDESGTCWESMEQRFVLGDASKTSTSPCRRVCELLDTCENCQEWIVT